MLKIKALGAALLLAFVSLLLGAAPAVASPKPSPAQVKATQTKGNPARIGGPVLDALPACGSPPCLKYSEKHQNFSAGTEPTGVSATVSVSNPYLATSANNNAEQDDGHSLVEVVAQHSDGGTPAASNIAEVGWTKDNQGVCATASQPCLFVFSWVSSVAQGYNAGNGWTNAPGCSPCAGDSLAGDVGTSKSFGLAYSAVNSRWEASYNGTVFGWWTSTAWATTPAPFVNADATQVFGELASSTTDKMCTDMGSGGHAGSASSTVVSGYALTGTATAPNLSGSTVSDPSIWAQTTVSATSFRLGGEGYNSVGGALGVKGSCAPATQGTPAAGSFQAWQEECPDLNGTTGCNAAWSQAWSSATVGLCVIIPNPGVTITNAVWNNSGSSGKTFAVYRSGTCGGTAMTFGNAAKTVLPSGWDDTAVRAFKRTA